MIRTRIVQVDACRPDPGAIAEAAAVLQAGGLVAFPTETVYGLGAVGLDAQAVERVFLAKGRPEQKGLILHLAALHELEGLVETIPPGLESRFGEWIPGPLTLVLRASARVPLAVTGGGSTVAVRWPAHPVAQALIAAAGAPVAAPSANLSGREPPCTAQQVLAGLDGRIEMVLDAGRTPLGVPSTVLDLSAAEPRVLRPGALPAAEIERLLRLASD